MSSVLVVFLGFVAEFAWVIAKAPTLTGTTQPAAPAPPAPVTQATRPLLAGGLLDEPGPTIPPPADIDPDTGELLGDRVSRIEEQLTELTRSLTDLGDVVGEQAELNARALGQLRREVERIGHVFPAPIQEVLPLEKAS